LLPERKRVRREKGKRQKKRKNIAARKMWGDTTFLPDGQRGENLGNITERKQQQRKEEYRINLAFMSSAQRGGKNIEKLVHIVLGERGGPSVFSGKFGNSDTANLLI